MFVVELKVVALDTLELFVFVDEESLLLFDELLAMELVFSFRDELIVLAIVFALFALEEELAELVVMALLVVFVLEHIVDLVSSCFCKAVVEGTNFPE